ncbi:hypothetical protein HXX76_001107 [Chlamydomonas incerta]|uniref:Protein kinase domain-containing protein n=1 Tax=Chlamydomonas incerta TaxID=51695 RepID=A0A836B0V5_CHLIN|nr:hypothetical protein HXX76_001107 [Chlamydomonas incerta]|eukprot:KAG2444351.1 hypothetical protein HXX76_001107 [Chlamydomonas incerta]
MLQLDHGNIITAYGLLKLSPQFPGLTGYTQPAYALVLELMEGGSLASIIVKQLLAGPSPKYTFSQAISWSLDVARALQYLHAGGRDGFPRIHRDVKLENVLLVEGGKVAKLADFGLQRGIFNQQQQDAPVLVRRSQRPASAVPLSPGSAAEGGGGATAGSPVSPGAAPGMGQPRTTPGPSRMAPADFAERSSQRAGSVTAGYGRPPGAVLSGAGGIESPSSRLGRVGSAASAGSGGGGGGRPSVDTDGAGAFGAAGPGSAPAEPLFYALDDKGLLPLQLPPPAEPADPYDPDADSAVRGPMMGPAERVREALELARRSHSMPQIMEPLGELDLAGELGAAGAGAGLGAPAGSGRPGSGRCALSRPGEDGEAGGGGGGSGAGPSRLAAMAGGAAGGGSGSRPVSGARTGGGGGGGVLTSPRGASLLAGGAGAAVLSRPSPLGGGSSQVSVRAGAKAGPAIQTQRSGNSISESMARLNASSLARSPHGGGAATAAAAAGAAAGAAAAGGSAAPSPREPGPRSAGVVPGAEGAVPVSLGGFGLMSDPGASGAHSGAGVGSGLLSGPAAGDGRNSAASCADILLDAVGGGSARNTTGGGMEGAVLGPSPSGAASLAARAPSSRQTSPTAAAAGPGSGGAGQGAAATAVDPDAVGAAADGADGLLSNGQRQLLPGSMKHVDSCETSHVADGSMHGGNASATAAAAAHQAHGAAATAAASAFALGDAASKALEDAQAHSLHSARESTAAEASTAVGMDTDGGTAPRTVSDLSAAASALTTHKSLGGGAAGGGGAANLAQLMLNGVSAGGGAGGANTEAQSAPLQPFQMADLLHMRLGAANVSVRSVRASGSGVVPPLSQRVMGSAPSSPRMAVAAAAAARAGIAPPPAAAGAARAASVSGARSRRSSATGLKGKPQAEFEEVFSLTGRTGSLVYLAPEAYKNEPYNDKVDVYSLAILMYELFGRTSITYTHISTKLPAFSRMLCNPDEFAERVAAGYRPPRPKAMDKLPPELWELIEAGWHQDPVQRPDIDTVVEALEELAELLAEAEEGRRNKRNKSGAAGGEAGAGAASQGCSCVIC